MRALLFGFSVTAGGFGEKLKTELRARNARIELDVVAMGGNHPDGAMRYFDFVGVDAHYDLVLFEVFTSGFRAYGGGAKALSPFVVLAAKARARGAEPVFLSLPRGDVDPFDDEIERMTRAAFGPMGIETIDVAKAAYAIYGARHMKQGFFKEDGWGVHPYPLYENWMVRLAADGVQRWLGAPREPGARYPFYAETCSVLSLPGLAPERRTHVFERDGLNCTMIELDAGETLTVPIEGRRINGIAFLAWPRAGVLELSAGDQTVRIQCLDQWSYYERFQYRFFEPLSGDMLTIRQDPAMPDIELLKGEPNAEPRMARIALLMYENVSTAELEARVEGEFLDA